MQTELRYAGFWVRFAGGLLDWVVLEGITWIGEMAILGAYYWIKIALGDRSLLNTSFVDVISPLGVQILDGVIYLIAAAPYYVYGHYRYGTTLGKRPFRVYVVDGSTGARITLRQSWIRFASYLASYIPFCTGFLMAAFHPEKKALHDLLARTASVQRPKKILTS